MCVRVCVCVCVCVCVMCVLCVCGVCACDGVCDDAYGNEHFSNLNENVFADYVHSCPTRFIRSLTKY